MTDPKCALQCMSLQVDDQLDRRDGDNVDVWRKGIKGKYYAKYFGGMVAGGKNEK